VGAFSKPLSFQNHSVNQESEILPSHHDWSNRSMSESKSIHDLVVAALGKMDVPCPEALIETLFVQDGCFVGHVFRYEGGYATWWLGSPTIEFHGDDGELLTMVSVVASNKEEAA
jgi:hypothetical protein